jgi:hypothetical protein
MSLSAVTVAQTGQATIGLQNFCANLCWEAATLKTEQNDVIQYRIEWEDGHVQ